MFAGAKAAEVSSDPFLEGEDYRGINKRILYEKL
jgi:hypothetical protein